MLLQKSPTNICRFKISKYLIFHYITFIIGKVQASWYKIPSSDKKKHKSKKSKKVKKKQKKHSSSVDERKNTVECENCGYKIVRPFPKDPLCPGCGKFSTVLFDLTKDKDEKPQPKQFETKSKTVASKLGEKVKIKQKELPDISIDSKVFDLGKGEYAKLVGVTSIERTQLYCSNEDLKYLLELTNNLDFIATGVLGGELHKMLLISVENNTKEKCQFHVKDGIIYIAYGNFPDKKGKWLLEQMSNNFAELINGQDVDNLDKLEKRQIENEFRRRIKYIITKYRELQKIFTDEEIPYVEDSIRIDYLGLSSMSIGIISLLTGEDLDIQLQMEVDSPEEEIEMKESMLTARIEAIAANTQGNTGAVPRWIAVKLGFQRFRFLTFKKYQNNYFLSLLSEGNLKKLEGVEELLDKEINSVTHTEFSGNLKPFNELKSRLNRKLRKKNKFPPFNFDDDIDVENVANNQ
ncbi:MAG: hypothetical protein ACFFBI_01985 [Promethearchaeota archaeon]